MTETLTQHPVLACVAELRAVLDRSGDVQPHYLTAEQKGAALRDLAAIEAQVTALRLGVMAVADDTAATAGARDVAAWWSHQTRAEPAAARADARLARSLDRDRPRVSRALGDGRLSVAQARVIADALDELPSRVGRDVLDRAEEVLVGYAADLRPSGLRRLGRRILDVVAPEVAEAEEARRLTDEEREARRRTTLHLRPLGDGTTRLTGVLPDIVAARLTTYLEAFTSPRRSAHAADSSMAECGHGDGPDRRPYGRRLGEAFSALLEHLDPSRLPDHGGDATTVVVTVRLDQLRRELGTASLVDRPVGAITGDMVDAGADLTAAEVRRLACTAQIIPAVLGGEGEVLDLGRRRRLFSAAQRRALRLRDRRCRAEGCTIPGTWAEAHHLLAWQDGGPTDLANGVLLCSHHHQRAHDASYRTDRLTNGDVRFVRRR